MARLEIGAAPCGLPPGPIRKLLDSPARLR